MPPGLYPERAAGADGAVTEAVRAPLLAVYVPGEKTAMDKRRAGAQILGTGS